ncbi:pentatricopeptide repeat-containing protein [Pyrus ussuriensis x Pyrus communis]|uniref:Pentatricopeptide repeat-containing protein n=1 Tax=Pyrus ussuriensis x Pyrus communis TaxID=2448454 RepID=A0A5N5FXM4_9ROSA|nr:pentatricopeptide repeat-containing protein [Pyrus ussuriensis x Pyrus communis]
MLASASPLNPHRLYRLQFPKRRQFRLRVPLSPPLIDFFDWACGSLGLHHHPQSFCALLHLLLRHRMLAPVSRLFKTSVGQFGTQFHFFDAFSDCFQNHSSDFSLVCSFLIENFCRNGMLDSSVDAFGRMYKLGVPVSPYALSRMLTCLVDSDRVHVILHTYGEICNALRDQQGFVLDIVASNKSLKRLCKENQIGGDGDFFTLLLRVGPKPNVVTFSTMVNTYCKDGKLEEANKLYKVMMEKGISPDLVVYSILVDGYFKAGRLEEGLRLFSVALDSRIKLDVVIFSSVMDAYVRLGVLAKSVEFYRRMLKQGISPNSVSYTILINGMCQDGKFAEACGLSGQILDSLIDGMCRIGNLKDAFQLYESMIKTGYEPDIILYGVFFFQAVYRGIKLNVYTFNMLIDGCCRLKRLRDAVKVYIKLGVYNIGPDLVMDTVLIKGISELGRLSDALVFFFQSVKKGFLPDVVTYCTLICFFEQLAESGPEPDVVTYNTMICGYCSQRRLDVALQLFEEMMQGHCLIDGCFKSENMKSAFELHEEMLKSISPNIVSYSILIDGLCKRGLVEKASFAFHSYGILIRGYCKVGRTVEGLVLYERMFISGIMPDAVIQRTIAEHILETDRQKYESTPNHMICR